MTYIGNITYDPVHFDEITFKVPITNRSGSTRCFYLDMYNENGKFLAREPATFIKLSHGETKTIKISSVLDILPAWDFYDVSGQKIKFVLKMGDVWAFGICSATGYAAIDTKYFDVATSIPPYHDPGLEPEPDEPIIKRGSLKVYSEPREAEIYINDIYKGLTEKVFVLDVGSYVVRVKKTGYYPYSEQITIKENSTSDISVTLDTALKPPTTPPTPPVVTPPPPTDDDEDDDKEDNLLLYAAVFVGALVMFKGK